MYGIYRYSPQGRREGCRAGITDNSLTQNDVLRVEDCSTIVALDFRWGCIYGGWILWDVEGGISQSEDSESI